MSNVPPLTYQWQARNALAKECRMSVMPVPLCSCTRYCDMRRDAAAREGATKRHPDVDLATEKKVQKIKTEVLILDLGHLKSNLCTCLIVWKKEYIHSWCPISSLWCGCLEKAGPKFYDGLPMQPGVQDKLPSYTCRYLVMHSAVTASCVLKLEIKQYYYMMQHWWCSV